MNNSNAIMFVLAIHIFSYLSIGLNIPVLRQCVGFIYLTFIPGFVIVRAFNMTEKKITETLLLSVALSVAFVMFVGLFINTLGSLLGVRAPLFANPSAVIMISLTLIIFLLSQRKAIGKSFNVPVRDFLAELNVRGVILCVLSVLLLLFSVVGALLANTYLIVLAIIGTATIFATCTSSKKVLPSKYYTFVLFVVSLGLLYQTSLLSRHVMGYDIHNEYYTFKLTRTVGYWSPPGQVLTFGLLDNYNSVLSITILPTIYSTFLNVDGDFIFKVVYPFIFALVPIFLYKTYEDQSGKLIALLAAFFFIADPIDFYGLESLSMAREMIGYLFFSAAIFSLLKRDLSTRNGRVLTIVFSAALAVSAYSLSFIYVFFIVSLLIALHVRERKEQLLNLSIVITILAIIFSWYMFVSTPPLNKLDFVINNIFNRFTQDVYSSQARLGEQYALLSPTVQTAIVGLFHKIFIYLADGFVVVGAAVIALRPKTVRFSPQFRWFAIIAAFVLVVVLAVPNVAPALNFTRFYRAIMMFLAPLFVVGGMYALDLFKRIPFPSRVSFSKVAFEGFKLLSLAIIVAAFFLFRSGFVNHVSGGYPISYSLDINSAQNFIVPDTDVTSARWLAAKVENYSLIYLDSSGVIPFIDYTTFDRKNLYYLSNTTKPEMGSYVFLTGSNVMSGLGSFPSEEEFFAFNFSDLSLGLMQNDKIYSNGQSEAYYKP